jgi:DNA-binding MarR family transcriptional regulator
MPRAPRGPTFHLALHVARLLELRLRALGSVPQGQARVIDALHRCGPLPVSALARGLHIAQPSATLLVQRLEAAGLVTRRASSDGRVWRIALSGRGRRVRASVQRAWEAVETELRGCLTPGENDALHRLLLKLRDGLGGASPDLEPHPPEEP